MIHYVKEKLDRYFKENLSDWCAGGPKDNGWTRTGKALPEFNVSLASCTKGSVLVYEALAKNQKEVSRWHLAFLNGEPQAYFSEYLDVRYDEFQANERARTFLDLLENIRKNGFDDHYPICVADVSILNIGFKFFRFDGCHRLCCAKHLGIKEVPAYIFSITEPAKI